MACLSVLFAAASDGSVSSLTCTCISCLSGFIFGLSFAFLNVVNNQNECDSTWITSRHFALLLGALIIISWPGIFLGMQSFVFRDFGYFSLPLACHIKESFWRMELPLWNPLSNCGQPFLAE